VLHVSLCLKYLKLACFRLIVHNLILYRDNVQKSGQIHVRYILRLKYVYECLKSKFGMINIVVFFTAVCLSVFLFCLVFCLL